MISNNGFTVYYTAGFYPAVFYFKLWLNCQYFLTYSNKCAIILRINKEIEMNDGEKMWTVKYPSIVPLGPPKDLSQPARKEDPPPALSENQRGQFTLMAKKKRRI